MATTFELFDSLAGPERAIEQVIVPIVPPR